MKKNLMMLLAALSLALQSQGQEPDQTITCSEQVNHFGLELFREISHDSGNMVFSPLSISAAMAMVYAGSRGHTAQEISRVLHYNPEMDTFRVEYPAFLKQLGKDDFALNRFEMVHSAWPQTGYDFLPGYIDFLDASFEAEINHVDYHTTESREQAIHRINGWVDQATQGKIPQLLSPGLLSPETRLVLTNAVYFKGQWLIGFDTLFTSAGAFYCEPGKHVEVEFMFSESEYNYFEDYGIRGLEIPYAGREFSMIVLLPEDPLGVDSLIRVINPEILATWQGMMMGEHINLYLPKFKVETLIKLEDIFTGMGMVLPFSDLADFSGMSSSCDLKIDKVIHRALIETDETGTEAAAATAVVMMETAIADEPPPLEFRVDHPFIFLLKEKKTGVILFAGRINNPAGT
ncbi:MAG: serpin family protein [Bacteroidales bacterium]|nr:serpin family protein [Bacteroidales bacterium]